MFYPPDGASDGNGPPVDAPPGQVSLVVSAAQLAVTEAAQGSFTVVLSDRPSGAVLVSLTASSDVKLAVTRRWC